MTEQQLSFDYVFEHDPVTGELLTPVPDISEAPRLGPETETNEESQSPPVDPLAEIQSEINSLKEELATTKSELAQTQSQLSQVQSESVS